MTKLVETFDLSVVELPRGCNEIIARMAKGGYLVSMVSKAKIGSRMCYSLRFYKGDEVIHVTGFGDVLSLYEAALNEAHRRYRESR